MNTNDTEGDKSSAEQGPARAGDQNKGSADTMPASKGNTKRRSKSPTVESVGQLVRSIYGGQFKRSTLKKTELSAMRSNPWETETEQKELLGLAQSDLLLDKTRQLMLLGIRIENPIIKGKIRDFALEVLLQHPLFKTASLTGVLRNLPESATEEEAISGLLKQNHGSVPWPEQGVAMTKSQYARSKSNAVHCLLMVSWATRGASLDHILRHLNSKLWAPAARRHKGEQDRLVALIGTRDPTAVSITYALLDAQAEKQRHLAESALISKERAQAHVDDLEQQLAAVQKKLEKADADARRINHELVAATESHATEKAHWKDDYEQLRGQMRRRMKEELVLLDEGLHALRRDTPKVHVMIDHAERAIDGIKREMDRIRGTE